MKKKQKQITFEQKQIIEILPMKHIPIIMVQVLQRESMQFDLFFHWNLKLQKKLYELFHFFFQFKNIF